MASYEHSYDGVMDDPFYDELSDEETQRRSRTNEALFKEAGSSSVNFLWKAVARSLLPKKKTETEVIEQTGALDIHDGSRAVSLAVC